MSEEATPRCPEMINVSGLEEFLPLLSVFPVVREKTSYRGPLYISGGKVRDTLLRRPKSDSDYDIWGNFDLEQIINSSNLKVINYWPEFRALKAEVDGKVFEFIATENVRADLSRNDINSSNIILLEDGTLEDLFGGLDSLRKKEIKVNEPVGKFHEDASQILRVFKFAELLGFTIEEETLEAIEECKGLISSSKKDNLEYEVSSILGLTERQILKITSKLQKAGIYLDLLDNYKRDCDKCISIERKLALMPAVKDVKSLFPDGELRLVGGAVREQIWGGKTEDFDFILGMEIEKVIKRLKELGYAETRNITLGSMEYYVNAERGVVSIYTSDTDVDIACRPDYEIETELARGDINFSCGIYDVHRDEFENPEFVSVIDRRRLEFCDAERISNDPLLILSALKQLSKVKGITISLETSVQITKGLPLLIDYLRENKDKTYKLDAICCNQFSESIYELFRLNGAEDLIKDSIERRLTRSEGEIDVICKPSALPESARAKIFDFVKSKYGNSFRPDKFDLDSMSSIFYIVENGEITTLFMLEGSRIYCIAANEGRKLESFLIDLMEKHNNLWVTISTDSLKVQKIFERIGFRRVHDKEKLDRLLIAENGKKATDVGYDFVDNGSVSFYDVNSPEYKQYVYAQ